jgi:hypothetical protein
MNCQEMWLVAVMHYLVMSLLHGSLKLQSLKTIETLKKL